MQYVKSLQMVKMVTTSLQPSVQLCYKYYLSGHGFKAWSGQYIVHLFD